MHRDPLRLTQRFSLCTILLAGLALGMGGCKPNEPAGTSATAESAAPADQPATKAAPTAKAVVYCSVDEEFGRMVFAKLAEAHGIEAEVVFDSEAGKTTGLVRKLEQEAGRPRADVFWSSELFNTILLARKGLLQPYDSPAAADIPARYRDSEHRWTAIGLRGRVLAYRPASFADGEVPTTWQQLAEAPYASQLALANPIFGTTRGHVAAMYALWGSDQATAHLTALRDADCLITDGNSAAVRAVLDGRAALAATDTDDVWVAQHKAPDLQLVYPDLGDGGTLLIPNSIALVANGPNPEAGRRLIDLLVSADVERLLAASDSRNIPVRSSLREELGMELPPETRLSYDAIADAMDDAIASAREILLR